MANLIRRATDESIFVPFDATVLESDVANNQKHSAENVIPISSRVTENSAFSSKSPMMYIENVIKIQNSRILCAYATEYSPSEMMIVVPKTS